MLFNKHESCVCVFVFVLAIYRVPKSAFYNQRIFLGREDILAGPDNFKGQFES